MDINKQKKFNDKMGKVQKFSKGGMIKKVAGRKYFDAGGATTLGGPGIANPSGSAQTVNNNGFTGTVGNLLGLNNQFQAQSANIQGGTNSAQLNNAYAGAQGGLQQQQNLADQVQPGVNQGVNTQAALTGQLQGVINGTGPNAAQAALNQNTSTNVANQAALMAGERGASANAGLLARQAAQQGAATQQQAVGQAATQQAQQQIAAQEQLANLAQTQVGQGAQAVQGVNNAQQNEQNILQGANTAENNANVAMQSNINNVNAGISTANQQQAGNIVNGITSAVSSVLPFAKGGEVGHMCAGAHCTDRQHSMHMMASGGPLQVNSAGAAGGAGQWLQSSLNTSGPQIDNAPVAKADIGNPFSKMEAGSGDDDEEEEKAAPLPGTDMTDTTFSNKGATDIAPLVQTAAMFAYRGGNISKGPHASHVANYLASGGEVEAMVSAGERYLDPDDVKRVVENGENPLKLGKKFEGKAKVKGDSLKNDTIKATLQEGGVVLPRHIMNKKNRDHAELFVRRAVHMKSPKGGK